jgi:hypothetical protein
MRKGCLAAVLVVGGAGLFCAHRVFITYWDFGSASNELPSAIEAYRAEGLPWRSSDLAPPPIPEGKNGAGLVRRATTLWPHAKDDIGFYSKDLEAAYKAGTIEKLLPKYEASLRLAHQAAQRGGLDFGWDLDEGAQLVMPELAGVQALARMLSERAAIRAGHGDDAGALADLEDARRLGVGIGRFPSMISLGTSAKLRGSTNTAVQRCLAAAAGCVDRLRRYRNWIAAVPPFPDLRKAFRGEIYATVATVRSFDLMGVGKGIFPQMDIVPFIDGPEMLGGAINPDPVMRREGTPVNVRSKAYMARCLQTWTKLSRASNGLREDWARIGAVATDLSNRNAEFKGESYSFTALLFPVFANFGDTYKSGEANQNVTLALADSLLFHAKENRWPASLDGTDPFSNQPLAIRFDGKRLRVWSVGQNRIDEKGIARRELRKFLSSANSDDIVASYPPIEP